MEKPNFSDELQPEAVPQRSPSAPEVVQRLGVSQHSLYAWKRQLAKVVSSYASNDAEIRKLKQVLSLESEEREILKKPPMPWAVDTK